MPKVSVVLPSLNVKDYIRECLQSVADQTLTDIEIICVDAGSTDGTLEILKDFEEHDPRIKVIRSDKKSYGYQVNLGMDLASGEYFAIVETDDYIAPDMYETLYAIADKNKLDFVKADFNRFYGEGESRSFSYGSITEKIFYGRVLNPAKDPDVMQPDTIYSWAGIYRLDFLKKKAIRHNETPGASYQDNGFWFQTISQAQRVMFVNRPFYNLRRDNPNSSLHSRQKVYCICEEYDFIQIFLDRHPEIARVYERLYAYYRYRNYAFTYDRIGEEFKKEFLVRFAQDFKRFDNAGLLDSRYFRSDEWNYLHDVMDDPMQVYYRNAPSKMPTTEELSKLEDKDRAAVLEERLIAANTKLKQKEKQFNQLSHSAAYKIGRMILAFPHAMGKGFSYMRTHGVKRTVLRLMCR